MNDTETPTKQGRILVVDDTPANLQVLTQMLTGQNYEVYPAVNGNLALMFVQSTLPDLILLDILMPDINGYDVCEKLKADDKTRDIPVIFVSALAESFDKVKAFSLGAVDYISKPFQTEEVLARVKTHLALYNLQKRLVKQNELLQQKIIQCGLVEKDLRQSNTELQDTLGRLEITQHDLLKTRDELIQSEKMASLGRLMAGFAHELNTPLGIAVGCASTMRREAKNINNIMEQEEVNVDELLSALESIEEGTDLTLLNLERANSLVRSFKRTTVDQTSDEVRIFSVHEVIEDTINTLHNRFKNTNIAIAVDCSKDIKVQSLPGALEQILMNLLINSLIHGFNEGQNAGNIKINVQLLEKNLHLEYSDDGKGIVQENLEKTFEPFFTTNRAHGGSGLGMYICYNIITSKLRGTITCESSPDKGVVFWIDYPVEILI